MVELGGPVCGSRVSRSLSCPSTMITGPGATTASKAFRLHAEPSLEPIETPAPMAQESSAGTHLRALRTEWGPGDGAYQCWYQLKSSPWSPVSVRSGATL